MDHYEMCSDLDCERSYNTFFKFKVLTMQLTQKLRGRWSVHLSISWEIGVTDDYWCVLCDDCYYAEMLKLLEVK